MPCPAPSWIVLTALLAFSIAPARSDDSLVDSVEHHFAKNGEVKIHYVTLGEGPLVVMLHGFPDYWYTWRRQMPELAKSHRVAAVDLRGYHRSDRPAGVESYRIDQLADDIVAVIEHAGADRATVVGHDWGGAIAWTLAMQHPEVVEQLVILNSPHPRGLRRELARNPEQRASSQYAREFMKPDAHEKLTPENLSFWVRDLEARKRYIEAFRKSDLECLLHYYRANYPREPYTEDDSPVVKVKCPVLVIHGLADRYLLAGALDGTWDWVEKDLTLVTVPGVGHFIQQDAAERVTRTIRKWLER